MQTDPAAIDQLIDAKDLAGSVLRNGWFKSTVTELGHDGHSAPENIAKLLGNRLRAAPGKRLSP
jgi:hypothetical protein